MLPRKKSEYDVFMTVEMGEQLAKQLPGTTPASPTKHLPRDAAAAIPAPFKREPPPASPFSKFHKPPSPLLHRAHSNSRDHHNSPHSQSSSAHDSRRRRGSIGSPTDHQDAINSAKGYVGAVDDPFRLAPSHSCRPLLPREPPPPSLNPFLLPREPPQPSPTSRYNLPPQRPYTLPRSPLACFLSAVTQVNRPGEPPPPAVGGHVILPNAGNPKPRWSLEDLQEETVSLTELIASEGGPSRLGLHVLFFWGASSPFLHHSCAVSNVIFGWAPSRQTTVVCRGLVHPRHKIRGAALHWPSHATRPPPRTPLTVRQRLLSMYFLVFLYLPFRRDSFGFAAGFSPDQMLPVG